MTERKSRPRRMLERYLVPIATRSMVADLGEYGVRLTLELLSSTPRRSDDHRRALIHHYASEMSGPEVLAAIRVWLTLEADAKRSSQQKVLSGDLW